MRQPLITLDRQALTHNVQRARELIGPDSRLMFAVKANAYGHGVDLVAPAVVEDGADELAVLDIATGSQVRSLMADTPLLAWLLGPRDDYSQAVESGLELGVSTPWQLDALRNHAGPQPVRVHLKIDTGLNRNGATQTAWPELVARALEAEKAGAVHVRAIWSHLADTSEEVSREALARLQEAAVYAQNAGLTPEILHLAASHAAVELPEARLDMVRLGILGYGVSPFDDHTAEDFGFQPVLTLHAPILHISDDSVTLGVGYCHGLLPPITATAQMTIAGVAASLETVGAAETRFRVTERPPVSAGEHVPVIGGAPGAVPVEQWARWAQTIGDEVLVRLRPELHRSFVTVSG